MNCATPSAVTGGTTQSASDLRRVARVGDADPETGPGEQIAIVLAVAERDALRRCEAEAPAEEGHGGRLRDVGCRELEEDRERFGDERAVAEALLHLIAQRVEP